MPLKPREMEKIILADGWVFKEQNGSHMAAIPINEPTSIISGRTAHTGSMYTRPKKARLLSLSTRAKSLTDERSYLFGDRRGLNKPLPFLQTR